VQVQVPILLASAHDQKAYHDIEKVRMCNYPSTGRVAIAGEKLPVFTKYDTGAVTDYESLGLDGGGKKIVAIREKFTALLHIQSILVQKSCQFLNKSKEEKVRFLSLALVDSGMNCFSAET
jgi:hypothetical protein